MRSAARGKEAEYLAEGSDYISMERWGHDHWSTLGYVETVVVDDGGRISNARMRCDARLHRHLAYVNDFGRLSDGGKYPTRLRDGELERHDDWSCLEDMVAAGLLVVYLREVDHETFGGMRARAVLTERGQDVALALRRHKGAGGSWRTFIYGGTA
jgi:hypothetical protein